MNDTTKNDACDDINEDKSELLETFLKLEELDVDFYRSTHLLRGRKENNRVYGGQVVGQALMAAHRTIDHHDFKVHSLHCNFLYAADADRPLLYQVTRIRDSRSFATRLVRARQGGKDIFSTSISFQKIEPDSITHQQAMPDVPPPEECENAQDFWKRMILEPATVSEEGKRAAEAYRKVLDFPETFLIKFINPKMYIVDAPADRPMKFACWVKNKAIIGEDEHLHHCIAAFISDIAPIGTPIGAHAANNKFRLDHSMWIHRHDFRIDDDWVLYETESTIAAASRALIHGKMWTRDGRMVLSSSQEILVRGQRDD
ncbi:unnamed protein product, partial [Mesorhabditis spiculigera]